MEYSFKTHWKWGALLVLVGGLAFGLYMYKWEFRRPLFEIHFFNLDRGRSVFIRTPHNRTIVVDGGQNSQVLRELTKAIPFYRRRIDAVIVTSAMPKNSDALSEVVRRYEVGRVMAPSLIGTSTALDALESVLDDKNIKIEKVGKGDQFVIDGVRFRVLFPDPHFKYNKTSVPELVMEISYGSTKVLLLGDVSKTIQKSFIPEVGKVDIVEYSHAGAKSRVSQELLDKIDADFVIKKGEDAIFVSDGKEIRKK